MKQLDELLDCIVGAKIFAEADRRDGDVCDALASLDYEAMGRVQRYCDEIRALFAGRSVSELTRTWDETNAADVLDEIEGAIQAGRAMGHGAFAIVNHVARMLSNTHPMFRRYSTPPADAASPS